MPHFIIEHAAVIDSHQLLTSVREAAVNSQLFTGPDIQVRAIEYYEFQPALFVHIQARIWQGRTCEQKHLLSVYPNYLKMLDFSKSRSAPNTRHKMCC